MIDTKEQKASIEQREVAFWDGVASELSDADLLVEPDMTDALVQRRLELLGDLKGKRVLDIGCGTGMWAIALAKQGADVCAIDISPESVAQVQRRAKLHGMTERVEARAMSATALDLPDAAFDVVHGQDIIHHVDAAELAQEVTRVLKPNGYAVFHENCANNPFLMLARNTLCGRFGIPKWSSQDEYPLTRAKLATFGKFFADYKVSFPRFVCFYYLDSRIFKHKKRIITRLCSALDSGIYKFAPFLRQYSYKQLIYLKK